MVFNFSTGLDSINEEDDNNNHQPSETDNVFNINDRNTDTTKDGQSANMLQFTRSLGALNAMSLGVNVLKAKVFSFIHNTLCKDICRFNKYVCLCTCYW